MLFFVICVLICVVSGQRSNSTRSKFSDRHTIVTSFNSRDQNEPEIDPFRYDYKYDPKYLDDRIR